MDNEQSQVIKMTAGGFAFSGASLNTLESTEYTLCVLALDTSVSIADFVDDLREALKSAIRSLQKSPRSDNLLVRILTFDRTVKEFHGFKELNKCVLTDYDNVMDDLGGATALYDAVCDGAASLKKYGEELFAQDYAVNGLMITISDGLNNNSSNSATSCATYLKDAVGEEKLESLVSILVGVNTTDKFVSNELKKFAGTANMVYVDIGEATPAKLAKLGGFISKSVSSQSQSLGTNKSAPIQSLTF